MPEVTIPVRPFRPLGIDPANVTVRAAIYHRQSAMCGVSEHQSLGFGQIQLHDRHRNGHRPNRGLGFGDDDSRPADHLNQIGCLSQIHARFMHGQHKSGFMRSGRGTDVEHDRAGVIVR